MKKTIRKPRKKVTRKHARSIAERYYEIYSSEYIPSIESFIAGFMAAKKVFPDYHHKICSKCFKLLKVSDFQVNREECRECRRK